ncbi:hypothetical protein GQ53DRAFT_767371 [Thozetella sp. PMI_491]|nr:hypothetical protein GQ53DRAFT_767371 [Thozetella sp. PMI_491]
MCAVCVPRQAIDAALLMEGLAYSLYFIIVSSTTARDHMWKEAVDLLEVVSGWLPASIGPSFVTAAISSQQVTAPSATRGAKAGRTGPKSGMKKRGPLPCLAVATFDSRASHSCLLRALEAPGLHFCHGSIYCLSSHS